jgi:hypothetical protein
MPVSDVAFADVEHSLDDDLDGEYWAEYQRYEASIIDTINSPQARSTTIRLVPRQVRPAPGTVPRARGSTGKTLEMRRESPWNMAGKPGGTDALRLGGSG